MNIFRRNPNEIVYNGGKKHTIDRIENTGDGDLLFWRQPEEDFNTSSPLIVYEGTEAVFLNNGRFEGILGPGKHNLTTDNIPFLSRFRNLLSGGISTFPCRIYFVKTSVSKEIGFGGRILVNDPVYNIPLPIQYFGGYNVIITNTGKFVEKLVGDGKYKLDRQDLDGWLKARLLQSLQKCLRNSFQKSEKELITSCDQIDVIAAQVSESFAPELEKYGILLENLALERLNIDENSIEYQRFIDIRMNKFKVITEAQGEADGHHILENEKEGFWIQQTGSEILRDAVNNPGTGDLVNVGTGIGMGVAAGGIVNRIADTVFSPMQPSQPVQQQASISQRFGVGGATQMTQQNEMAQLEDKLARLEKMHKEGRIPQAEYEVRSKQIRDKMFEV